MAGECSIGHNSVHIEDVFVGAIYLQISGEAYEEFNKIGVRIDFQLTRGGLRLLQVVLVGGLALGSGMVRAD